MPRGPKFGFDRIRAFAHARVRETSLREVARDVGMSYSGLHSFLRGGEPYLRTRERLRAWYLRTHHQGAPPPTHEEVDAALMVLTQHLHRGGVQQVSEAEVQSLIARLRKPDALPEPDDVDER